MFSFKFKNLKFLNQLIFFKSKFYFVRMKRKNLKIFKFFDDRRIGAIPRIFLTSIFVVFSFYHIPSIVNFASEQFSENKEWLFCSSRERWYFNIAIKFKSPLGFTG